MKPAVRWCRSDRLVINVVLLSFLPPPPLWCSSCDSLGRLARAVWQWRTEQTNSWQIKLRPRRLRIGPPTSTRYESPLSGGGALQLGSPLFYSISLVSLWLTPYLTQTNIFQKSHQKQPFHCSVTWSSQLPQMETAQFSWDASLLK